MQPLKSGLDPDSQFVLGETREDFVQLQAEYYGHYAPTTPDFRFQVDNLIRNEWLLRRFHRVEAHLWEFHALKADRSSGVILGEAFAKFNADFMRLQRRITAAEKAYKDAKLAIAALQKPPEAPLQPEQTKPETEQLGSFLQMPPLTPIAPQPGSKKKIDWHQIRMAKPR